MRITEEGMKNRIIDILKKHPEGLTIENLSKMLNVHRQTVTKYVLELKGAGIIHRRRIGAVTLHYLKNKFIQRLSEEKIIEQLGKRIMIMV